MIRLQTLLARLRFWHLLALAAAARLAVLGAWLLFGNPAGLVPLGPEAGEDGYIQIGQGILEGHYAFWDAETGQWLPAHRRPPVTPLLMAATSAWNPAGWYVQWMAVAFGLGLLTVWLGYRALRELRVPPAARNLALLVLALHPVAAGPVRAVTSLPVNMCVLALLAWLWVRYAGRPGKGRALALGAGAGLAALTHGGLLPLAAVLLVAILCFVKTRFRLREACLALGMALLVIAPWTLRNYSVFDRFIPVVSGAGLTYWLAEGIAENRPDLPDSVYAHAARPADGTLRILYYSTPYPSQDDFFLHLAIRDIREHPGKFAWRYVRGLFHFWVPAYSDAIQRWVAALLNLPLVLGWMVLFFRTWRIAGGWREKILGLEAILLALWALFAIFYPSTGYVAMVLPLLLVAAGWRLGQAWDKKDIDI